MQHAPALAGVALFPVDKNQGHPVSSAENGKIKCSPETMEYDAVLKRDEAINTGSNIGEQGAPDAGGGHPVLGAGARCWGRGEAERRENKRPRAAWLHSEEISRKDQEQRATQGSFRPWCHRQRKAGLCSGWYNSMTSV